MAEDGLGNHVGFLQGLAGLNVFDEQMCHCILRLACVFFARVYGVIFNPKFSNVTVFISQNRAADKPNELSIGYCGIPFAKMKKSR
jgi:hypothetical protein